MGCQNAKSSQKEDCEDEKELGDFLTVEEIEVIRHTWAIVKQDIPGTGMFMFTRLFELQSDFKKFFKRMMTQTETGEYDFDRNKLGNHANVVMTALDKAVDSLDDSSFLSKGLAELGERHKMYNVKSEMIPYMWPAVRDALKKALAEDFTVEAELAWKHVFDYIVSKMAQGINSGSGSPTKTSTPKNISPLHDSGANGIPP
ncbi:neuroglobin-like [Pomacea canaliculata]|uniref:neuroglobin-like n=1 Tax=Pomacea canaliculata TaxID=400727 RepID=UPI000D729BE4|nr:neuroglobin-like [Pomacea canaliculata]